MQIAEHEASTLVSTEHVDKALDYLSDLPHVTNWYSGRGMFGRYCFGFTLDGDDSDLVKFFMDLVRLDPQLAEDLQGSLRRDSMGHSTIFYFPGFRLDGKSRYRSEDDDDLEAFDVEERGL